ncbi:FliM/FliN family flagellar motor switch protein [Methylocystis sp. MJC1]|uniref:FliM/FliN family flagellar motor switch protein n=1 Tax=Methylocystis sp. MJC1 TaxID=2654282 RepID=UPI0013ECBB9B|nr:FliM/FliN family flagellar motor switch protein [Methylocystis sp. MJC1]KAF2990610.1 Flagellar motor switch protein FliM [Methylocystis sp. MJC1]MBU6525729.1 FliM/FliN family flagellar motor switch protein [Methylocystis sp. MJC1]UZX12200.1 FliM/FliN family flagellar motor switch protein [Methylocystis sp. MJC1]
MSVDLSRPPAGRAPLVANGVATVGRLPVLRAIFDEAATRFEKAISETTGADVDFQVKDVLAVRVGDAKDAGPAVASVFQAPELRCKVAVGINVDLALMLVDLLFGSSVSIPFNRRDHGLTKVESRAVEYAITSLIDSFQAPFSNIVNVSYKLESTEPELDWFALAGKGAAIVVCKFVLQTQGRQGEAFLAIPRIALDPYNDVLSRTPNANGNVEDAAWAQNLRDQVVRASVKVSAVMEKRGLTLGDVARFHVGQLIALPFSPTSLIPLRNGSRPLFNCELGQKEGFYTVRIEEKIDGEQEFINRIIDQS